ncbi:MAG: hypothetical protein HY608_04405, partial [Planctomycetes bacterium]|nr:hypothetical protein [Planctomycetota bacterium]
MSDIDATGTCRAALAWAAERDYTGWNKFDALASPFLRAASLGTCWGRLVVTQAVKRSPWNVRPLLGVPKLPNLKGWALFAQAHATLWTLERNAEDRGATRMLLAGIVAGHRDTPWGWGWGYPHPWQDWGFYVGADEPNRVVTAYAVEALLDAGRRIGETGFLNAAARGADFLARSPDVLSRGDGRAALTYVPVPGNPWVVVDVSALAGASIAEAAAATGERAHLDLARRLVRFVLSIQTAEGAWFYADPPSASPIRHDNYHTGFILDALLRYARATGDEEPMAAYRRGL